MHSRNAHLLCVLVIGRRCLLCSKTAFSNLFLGFIGLKIETLILLNGFLPCFGFFFICEFYNVINGYSARNSLTHFYIVLIVVVNSHREDFFELSSQQLVIIIKAVATAFLHFIKNVGYALLDILVRFHQVSPSLTPIIVESCYYYTFSVLAMDSVSYKFLFF